MIAKNNLFNIRYNPNQHWFGEVGHCDGFVIFDRLEFSIRACLIVLRSYYKRGIFCIRDIVYRFAPPSENNCDSYIFYLCNELAVSSTQKLDSSLYLKLVVALAYYETNTRIFYEDVDNICLMFGVYPCPQIVSAHDLSKPSL